MSRRKRREDGNERCETHHKVIYRSFFGAIPGALKLAELSGTARIYWQPECNCYHLTSQADKLRRRNGSTDGD